MAEADCYLGVKRCGCAVAIVVDTPEHQKEVRKSVAEFMRGGLVIERVTRDDGVDRLLRGGRHCTHGQAG